MADNTVNSPAPGNWRTSFFTAYARQYRAHRVSGRSHRFSRRRLFAGGHPGAVGRGRMDKGAATTGTILVFVAGTLLMAFYANLPFIVGPHWWFGAGWGNAGRQ